VLSQFDNPQVLLSPELANVLRQQVLNLGPQGAQLFDALYGAIKIGLVGALHDVFFVGAVLGVLGVLVTLLLKEVPLRKSYAPATELALDETAAQVGQDAFPSLPPLRPQDQPPVPTGRETGREKGLVA
jgi:hypothetical protein